METTRTTRTALAAAALVITTLVADRAHAADAPSTTTPNLSRRRIVVSIPDRKLAVIENDAVVTVFPVAVGAAATPSPIGTFTVVNRVWKPTFYKRGKAVAAGAGNPVGTRWIGLSRKGYGIHGTDCRAEQLEAARLHIRRARGAWPLSVAGQRARAAQRRRASAAADRRRGRRRDREAGAVGPPSQPGARRPLEDSERSPIA
jgi:hypothetical protein